MSEQDDERLAVVPTEEPAQEYDPGDQAIVRIYHPELDAYGETPRAGLKFLPGWQIVEPSGPVQAGEFDPSEHTVSEVQEHLAKSDEAEQQRVLAAEKAGRKRSTLVGHEE